MNWKGIKRFYELKKATIRDSFTGIGNPES